MGIFGDNSINKTEVIGVVVRLTILSAISFFSLKWVLNQIDPTVNQKKKAIEKANKICKRLGLTVGKQLTDYEMVIASHLVDPSDISVSWRDIAGLEDVIQELQDTVILPIQRKELFSDSQLTQPPKGVLLYGPPGCGKTLIAKATAKEAGTRFINLDVSILTDKWYGESQKLAAAVFTLAVKIQPCIVFIDEIDAFLRMRAAQDHEATAMMKAQFMSFWDGLITDQVCTVIVMGATNRPLDLDKAILRRMPSRFNIGLPDQAQRLKILKLILGREPVANDVDYDELASETVGFSGSDIKELCRNASLYRVRDFNRTASLKGPVEDEFQDALRPITMEDLTASINKFKESKFFCAAGFYG
ncbi:outer mitochondrial transmembrane helix translocase-like [Hetaerina americana]|uniref:outer mitochondrial transmembrane helix translocase-like n=1 Tax=Hetaerina americana TaxID=62018 RepID=UPI003A7F111E